ncbi:hypothetical protein [Zhenhengia sp.]|uniref:hypothetical protein n=1 Tax=Zhenhengia sp. TaxID=2944208 RepID=UPI003079E1EB
MRAYKLSVSNEMGFEMDAQYFKSLSKAKKQFKQLLNAKLKDEDIATDEEDMFWTYSSKKDLDIYHSKEVRKEICIPFWHSYHTDCGTEHDVTREFIRLENIEIN